jgi:hypothetical protein
MDKGAKRIGALDIAAAVSERIGSYVHAELFEFVAVEDDDVHCWYMNSGGEGPSFEITMTRRPDGWHLNLIEHPPGTEQSLEVP